MNLHGMHPALVIVGVGCALFVVAMWILELVPP